MMDRRQPHNTGPTSGGQIKRTNRRGSGQNGERWTNRVWDGLKEEESQDDSDVSAFGPPDLSRRNRARDVLTGLAGAGKWGFALQHGTLSATSFAGTESWADYGQVALATLMLETLLAIDEKLEILVGTEQPHTDD
jgi:hypothetical protein